MTGISRNFGLIYQIADDFEDIEQDLNRSGKNLATNYPICKGIDEARSNYYGYVKKFKKMAKSRNVYSGEIDEIINYLNKKVSVYYNIHNK